MERSEINLFNYQSEDEAEKSNVNHIVTTFFFDVTHSTINFVKESITIKKMLKGCNKILIVGCGVSRHMHFLSKWFNISGLDQDESIIKVARNTYPECGFYTAKITNFGLGTKFDAILSLNGYIGHSDDLCKTINCYSKHLNTNGFILIKPWMSLDNYDDSPIRMFHETTFIEDVSAEFIETKNRNGKEVAVTRTRKVNYFGNTDIDKEEFTMYLHQTKDFNQCFKNNGFEVKYKDNFILANKKTYKIL